MAYTDRFIYTDKLVNHLGTIVNTITDSEIKVSYAGFLSVSAVTVYELAIKDIFIEFAMKQNKIFGTFVEKHFSRVNGRIKISDIVGTHIIRFGQKYRDRYNNLLQTRENIFFQARQISIKSGYDNLIQCRHNFVHKGSPTLTINEVIEAYELGKEVIVCIQAAMIK